MAHSVSPTVISLLVVTLLFADLFVAVPTLTIMLLAGFFLGPMVGAVSAIGGLSLAGFCGYFMSDRYGDKVLRKIVRDDKDRADAMESFQRHGTTTILLSRAVPILPEVSACMAGLTKMRLRRFAVAWLASTIPYAMIATYAGSMSSVSNPQPAIYTAIGLTVTLWLAWFIFCQYKQKYVLQTSKNCHYR